MRNKIYFFILVSFTLIATNRINAQNTLEPTNEIKAINLSTNTLLDSSKAIQLTKNYKKRYTRFFNKKHTKWIYFPKNYFLFIDSFLKKETLFGGIRFYFASYKEKIDANQQTRDKQITLLLAPSDSLTEGNFEKFLSFDSTVQYLRNSNKVEICPKGCKGNRTSTLGPEYFLLLTETRAKDYIKCYMDKYFDSSKKHTKSLYMPRDNFQLIGNFFNSPVGSDYDGIRVSFAAYHAFVKGINQAHKKQITLVLTATKNEEPDYNALINFWKDQLKHKVRIYSVNHGSLCPNSCP